MTSVLWLASHELKRKVYDTLCLYTASVDMEAQNTLTMGHLIGEGTPPPEPDCPGMLVSVVLLRNNGKRVLAAERKATSPLIGRLVLDDFPRGPSMALVCARQAQLFANKGGSVPYSIYKPLFDPEIVHWDSRGIVIRGYEINSKDGESIECAQVWMVTPILQ